MTLGPSEPLIPSTIVNDIDGPGLRRVGIIVGAVDAERLHVSVERLLHGLRVHTIDGFVATGVLLWLVRRQQIRIILLYTLVALVYELWVVGRLLHRGLLVVA